MAFIQEESGYYIDRDIDSLELSNGMIGIRDTIGEKEVLILSPTEAISLAKELLSISSDIIIANQNDIGKARR